MAKSKAQTKGDIRMADLLDRQDGVGKYAPKKNNAINNSVKPKAQLGLALSAIKPGGIKENWRSGIGATLGGPLGMMLGSTMDKKAGLRRTAKADAVDRQDGAGKYTAKKKMMKSGGSVKKSKSK
jgi:hypothetical protein